MITIHMYPLYPIIYQWIPFVHTDLFSLDYWICFWCTLDAKWKGHLSSHILWWQGSFCFSTREHRMTFQQENDSVALTVKFHHISYHLSSHSVPNCLTSMNSLKPCTNIKTSYGFTQRAQFCSYICQYQIHNKKNNHSFTSYQIHLPIDSKNSITFIVKKKHHRLHYNV